MRAWIDVLFWVGIWGAIAWGIVSWWRWREREQDAIRRHQMVLMRLDHLEERVKRLGRAIHDPDTLADDDEDAFHDGGTK